ncbi:MAG: hypothetical protein Q7U10_08885 [Thermodesulfovibrionia bacterium]|nr:hypothetical protein [Thermodesulfovibrionia bacterium]
MANKHFNKGIAWGKLEGLRRTTSDSVDKKPYLKIYLHCHNALHGNVKVYGRIWGADRIAEAEKLLMDEDKQLKKGMGLRLEGFFNQYDKKVEDEITRLSNFTFFQIAPYDGTEYRAVFILTGVIEIILRDLEEGSIRLSLDRQGNQPEEFLLYTDDQKELKGLEAGQTVQIKGMMAEQGEEDYFGASSGIFRAYAKEIKILEEVEVF